MKRLILIILLVLFSLGSAFADYVDPADDNSTATLVARIVTWCLGPGWQRVAEESQGESPDTPERIASRVLEAEMAADESGDEEPIEQGNE